MLVKLTKGRELNSDEQKKIKGGGIMGFFCGIILAIIEPDACGDDIYEPVMKEMILSESVLCVYWDIE